MKLSDWLFFLVVMFLSMMLGGFILQYIPGIDDPYLANLLGFVIGVTPGYILYNKYRKKIE